MRPFTYERADSPMDAVRTAGQAGVGTSPVSSPGQFVAGGTTILDLMKLDVMRPQTLVDINPLSKRLGQIETTPRGIRLGALVRMAEAAEHPVVARDYVDPIKGKPYSSRSLMRCYDEAARAFGWDKRERKAGSMRDRDWLVGYGCATASIRLTSARLPPVSAWLRPSRPAAS